MDVLGTPACKFCTYKKSWILNVLIYWSVSCSFKSLKIVFFPIQKNFARLQTRKPQIKWCFFPATQSYPWTPGNRVMFFPSDSTPLIPRNKYIPPPFRMVSLIVKRKLNSIHDCTLDRECNVTKYCVRGERRFCLSV